LNENDISLKALIPFADSIQATMGQYCEVAIHDLTHPDKSLIYIVGNVTNREIGAPITDLVLRELRKHGDRCPNLTNYNTTTRDGKRLRSSTTFARTNNKIIGCMCINLDISPFIKWKNFFSEWLETDSLSVEETFTNDVTETLNHIIVSTLESYQIPIANLIKEDKLDIISQLDEKGVFLVKGSIELVASSLSVSRYSIYNYLDEVRNQKHSSNNQLKL
jgi:Uncharacterized protein conserved in bacteria